MTLAARVKKVLDLREATTLQDIEALVEVGTYQERRKLKQALADLAKAGAVEVIPGAVRTYRLARRAAGRGEKQVKLWRAVGIKAAKNESFTGRDLAVLAETSQDYAKRWLGFLRERGWLLSGRMGNKVVLRFNPEREWTEDSRPHFNRRVEKRQGNVEKPATVSQSLRESLGEVEDALGAAAGLIETAQEKLLEIKAMWGFDQGGGHEEQSVGES
jgi:hypothetical protein